MAKYTYYKVVQFEIDIDAPNIDEADAIASRLKYDEFDSSSLVDSMLEQYED